MNLTMMLVFAVMAYGALGSAKIVDDFRVGVQMCRNACEWHNNDGAIQYTPFLSEALLGGQYDRWSGWSGRNWQKTKKQNSFRVGLFTQDGQEAGGNVRIKGVDFRIWIEVDNSKHHTGSRHYRKTKWASEAVASWTGWARHGSSVPDLSWMRVRLEVRADHNLVINNVKIGAHASTDSRKQPNTYGNYQLTQYLRKGSSWSGRARHSNHKLAGLKHARIYMEAQRGDTSSPAMAAEKEAMHSDLEVVGEPSNEWNPMAFAALIGAAALAIIAVLVVMLGRWMKRKQPAKEAVAEMSEVADTPNVVHVAEETAEAVTTGSAPETETETVAAAPEAAVEVVVKEEAVEMEAVSGGDVL